MEPRGSRGPGVWLPPPLIFAAGLLIGWFLDAQVHPMPLVSLRGEIPMAMCGAAVLLVGACLSAWGLLTFVRAKTAVAPIQPATKLVQHGPYRYTRNPMYIGMTIAYIGLAAFMDTAWPLLLLPLVILGLYRFVIVHEEAYLQREFGDLYDDYRRRVRRWL